MTDRVGRLHRDRELVEAFRKLGDTEVSCADAYRADYHERFFGDLEIIVPGAAPFVDVDLIDWMTAEAKRLERVIDASPAFAAPASAACHRDLWLENLMVTAEGRLHILNWDEMGMGDPVMDWAMLLGPSRYRVAPANDDDAPALGLNDEETERYRLYARASLLDWIIDPLADWIDAEDEPEQRDAMRDNNRRVHEEALELYRRIY